MTTFEKKQTILKAENISLTLNNNLILRDINLHIEDIVRPGVTTGQVVALLAPSGVGKTQLLRILSGLIKPTTGTVLIGDPLAPVKLGEVGVVQQNYPLFEHRTVLSNLSFINKKYSAKEGKEKAEEYLQLFNLWDKRDLYPASLSGGQKQRVAIVQQLLSSNHFILLDEPFSGLDINMTAKVADTIEKIAGLDELNTVVIVSHDIPSTCAISETVWLLGKDRDLDNPTPNSWKPGAYIKKEYDLMSSDLAWHKDIWDNPRFNEFVKQIRSEFKDLG